jgi:hypothetical protein
MHSEIFGTAISIMNFTILPKFAASPIFLIGSENIAQLNSNPFSTLIAYVTFEGSSSSVSAIGFIKFKVIILSGERSIFAF